MKINHIQLIKTARKFWSKVANENDWTMENRGCTIWINKDGEMQDSLYNPTDSKFSHIVDYETEELIKTIKH